MEAQPLADKRNSPDLSVREPEYFGVDPDHAANAHTHGLRPHPDQDQQLYRVGYLFLLVFGSDDDDKQLSSEYGGMQLRAETFIWAENGQIPVVLQRQIQRTAHKAAYIFDSDIETAQYGANSFADGYLSGFDPWENGHEYANWEVEPVARGEQHNPPGVIDWSTEIYLDVKGLKYANLSGAAAGISNPWRHETQRIEGQEAIHVAPHVWKLDTYDSRPGYYELRPPAGTDARERYREGAGNGKMVYINGKYVGQMDDKGRAWLKKEYSTGKGWKYGSDPAKWSRKGLVEASQDPDADVEGATWQALRKGGSLYLTGETEEGVYLSTVQHAPDGWEAGDPDSVPTDLEVQEGKPGGTRHMIYLDEPGAPLPVECRDDREVIKHLGLSNPPYRHHISEMFRWPEFRPVERYGIVYDPGEQRDETQTALDDYGEDL